MSPAPVSAVIVGAGIVGAACAEALAEAGVRVQVLERARAGGGVTAAGMGHVLVLDDSEAQFALTRLGRQLWDERAGDWPATVEREVCGTIWVAADDAELAAAHAKHGWYAERGVPTELLGPTELRRAEPNLHPHLAGGLRIPGDSVVYPPAATARLLQRAVAAGARIDEQVAVRRCGDGHLELDDGGRIEADVVVVAAGVHTPRLVELDGLVVRPKKGHLAITDRRPGFVRHQLVELGYLASAHGEAATSVAFNVQPRATGQLLLGSSRQLDVTDPRVEPPVLARMIARACRYLPALADLPVVRAWTGLRPATPDNLPVIGAVPGRPRLWLATGHEGTGITTSLATARLLVDRLLGRTPPIDGGPYDVARLGTAAHHG